LLTRKMKVCRSLWCTWIGGSVHWSRDGAPWIHAGSGAPSTGAPAAKSMFAGLAAELAVLSSGLSGEVGPRADDTALRSFLTLARYWLTILVFHSRNCPGPGRFLA